jgi:hypothetical protein
VRARDNRARPAYPVVPAATRQPPCAAARPPKCRRCSERRNGQTERRNGSRNVRSSFLDWDAHQPADGVDRGVGASGRRGPRDRFRCVAVVRRAIPSATKRPSAGTNAGRALGHGCDRRAGHDPRDRNGDEGESGATGADDCVVARKRVRLLNVDRSLTDDLARWLAPTDLRPAVVPAPLVGLVHAVAAARPEDLSRNDPV